MKEDVSAAARGFSHVAGPQLANQGTGGTVEAVPDLDFVGAFDEYFELIPVDSPALRAVAHRLRFDVYSREIQLPGFEAWRFPDQLEIDDYDVHSAQSLLRHKPSARWVGVVRLVLAPPDGAEKPFPVEHFAEGLIDSGQIASLPRQRTGEISRLILTSEFRRRRGEATTRYGNSKSVDLADRRRRQFPHPLLGLMVGTMRMSVEHGVTHWLAGMEPRLNRMLERFGLQLTPIGPEIDYHGRRRPYIGRVSDVMENAYFTNRAVWDLLSDRGRLYRRPTTRSP